MAIRKRWTIGLALFFAAACPALAEDGGEEIKQGIEDTADQAGDAIQEGWQKTKGGTVKAANQTGDAIQEGWQKTKDGTVKAANDVGDSFK